MSTYSEKIARGETPNAAEWAEHLQESHARSPGLTPKIFAQYRATQGWNSYQMLASVMPKSDADRTVLDLACGDGHLIPSLLMKLTSGSRVIGIDMSEGELEVARRQVRDPRVSFQRGMAQDIPLAPASVDWAFCHMAFMLMTPVEPVIAELARVLKTGGSFSAVIPNGRQLDDTMMDLGKIANEFIDARYPAVRHAPFGDSRTSERAWVSEQFKKSGFETQIRSFALEIHTDPQGVWTFMKDTYHIELLKPEEKALLEQEILQYARGLGETATFEFPLLLIAARKS